MGDRINSSHIPCTRGSRVKRSISFIPSPNPSPCWFLFSQTHSTFTPNPVSKVETCKIAVLFLSTSWVFFSGSTRYKSLAWEESALPSKKEWFWHCLFLIWDLWSLVLTPTKFLACYMLWSQEHRNLTVSLFIFLCLHILHWPTHVLPNL